MGQQDAQFDQHMKNMAQGACEFMKKATLTGVEVAPYSEVWNFLNAIFAGELMVAPAAEMIGLRESDDEIAIMQECITRWPKSVGTRVDQVRAEKAPAA